MWIERLQARYLQSHDEVPIPAARWRAALLIAALLVLGAATTGLTQEAAGQQAAANSDCFSCHASDANVLGPAWVAIAKRYTDTPTNVQLLAGKIIHGEVGDWGSVPMPPHLSLSEADAQAMVKWVLTVKGAVISNAASYSYKTPAGNVVVAKFRVFKDGNEDAVTDAVAQGFDKYNTYCARCHGVNVRGTGGYTPDLKASLEKGLNRHDFFLITMEGRTKKGMPKWAGTLTADEMNQIFEYIKARSLGLIGEGVPPTD